MNTTMNFQELTLFQEEIQPGKSRPGQLPQL